MYVGSACARNSYYIKPTRSLLRGKHPPRSLFSPLARSPPCKNARRCEVGQPTTGSGGNGADDGSGAPGGRNDPNTTHTIVVAGATAAQADGFIARAWAHFREERRRRKRDRSRYLYMPVPGARSGGGGGGGLGGDDGGGGGGARAAGGGRWVYKR